MATAVFPCEAMENYAILNGALRRSARARSEYHRDRCG